MEKSRAISIAKSRKVIPQPGKFTVKATLVSFWQGDEDSFPRYIVGLAAMTAEQGQELTKGLQDGDYLQENYEGEYQNLLNATHLSINIPETSAQSWLPSRRELVHVNFEMVPSREGDTNVLRATGITAIPVTQASNFSFEIDEDTGEAIPVEAESAKGIE